MTTEAFPMTTTPNENSSTGNGTIENDNEGELRKFVTTIAYSRVLTVVVFLGIVSNILNLITLSKKQFRAVFYVCLRALAIADLSALLAVAPYTINLYSAKPKATYPEAFYAAHVQLFLMKLFEGVSVLTVVLMTIERYIALCMALRSKSLLIRKRIVTGIVISWITSFAFNFPRIFERGVVTRFKVNANSTLYHSGLSDFANGQYYNVHKYIYNAFFRVICTLVIIVLNVKIIIQIRRSASERNKSLASLKSNNHEERHATFMLLGVTVLFLLSYLPPIYTYIVQGWKLSYIAFVLYVASDVVSQLNFAMNFFVYCCCSKGFRLALRDTLRCAVKKPSSNAYTASSSNGAGAYAGSRIHDESQGHYVQTISKTC